MKKKVRMIILGIVVLLVVAIFIGMKIYHFIVIRNVYEAIENFRSESNRYYLVCTTSYNKITRTEEVLLKDNIAKWNEQVDQIDEYCKWRDSKQNKEYLIYLQSQKFKQNNLLTTQTDFLKNLPSIILGIYQNDRLDLKLLLRIKYILPINYNNQKCYKIITNTQTLIVSKDTYLPIYFSTQFRDAQTKRKNITEITYQFKVGEVTDEDIALPDLTGYTEIMEE